MKVTVKRTGGFAGLDESKSVDTQQMNPATAQQIEQVAKNLNFFKLPESTSGGVGADFIRYQITVSDEGRQHTVAFDDDGSDQNTGLRRLADLITG